MFFSLNRFFSKKHLFNGIHFRDLSKENYEFHNVLNECYGYINGKHVCTFENLNISGTNLHIDHFALHSPFIGKNYGEQCLRAFAKMLSVQREDIKTIDFSLYKTTGDIKNNLKQLEKVRDARKHLLEKIGAKNIKVEHPSELCYDVTGIWDKSMW